MEEEIKALEPNAYLLDSVQSNLYKFDIDEDFETPSQVRDLLRLLDTQEESDTTILRVNHFGGCKFTLLSVIDSIRSSKGQVIAQVVHASSAGSLLSLSCDDCYTVPYGEWYIHEMQSGHFGDTSYQKKEIEFLEKTQRRLFEDIYKEFLTEKEIDDLCKGKVRDYNFDDIEANKRLENWRAYKESLNEEAERKEQDDKLVDELVQEIEKDINIKQEKQSKEV